MYFGGLNKSASENHRFSPENIKRRMGRTVEGPSSAAGMSNTYNLLCLQGRPQRPSVTTSSLCLLFCVRSYKPPLSK